MRDLEQLRQKSETIASINPLRNNSNSTLPTPLLSHPSRQPNLSPPLPLLSHLILETSPLTS